MIVESPDSRFRSSRQAMASLGGWTIELIGLKGVDMTKRERLSFGLRQLRSVKAENNVARRIQGAHEIIKEVINELSKGVQTAELGQHIIQLLDELYAQNTGAIVDGRLPIPPMMPDCADQIHAQTKVLRAIPSDSAQTSRTETAEVLHHTLSLYLLYLWYLSA